MSYIEDHYKNDSEESYFVSMTDIMVGMIFVFIILLMYFVFRIQNTSEPVVPLSEHKAVMVERDSAIRARDGALRDRDNAIKGLDLARDRIKQLEAEIERLKNNELDRYLTSADRDRRLRTQHH